MLSDNPTTPSPDSARRRQIARELFSLWINPSKGTPIIAGGVENNASANVIGAKRLQELMNEASITVEVLATKTELNQQTIKQYLRGSTQPRRKNLKLVAEALTEALKRQVNSEDIFPNVK